VFVVREGRAAQQVVKVGRSLGDDREITDGLKAGDAVVLAPPDTLVDGADVDVVTKKS
jgi:multidrug efflux pump subunit AcrA (membrane-fusion protein)